MRREFLFLYDCKHSNPNGDPDQNQPRIDPATGKCYVTDVRLKRFIRDYLSATLGEDQILVTRLGNVPVTIKDRVAARFKDSALPDDPAAVQQALCETFVDLRLFGSPLAFNLTKKGDKLPSLTGPIQISFGESLHAVHPVNVRGTSTFTADSEKAQGTFTDVTILPYALIGFHGVLNETAAAHTGLSEDDVALFQTALWKSVREAPSANTRSKTGQQPQLLLTITYQPGSAYHIGRLADQVRLLPNGDLKGERQIRGPDDFRLGFGPLLDAVAAAAPLIDQVDVALAPGFATRYDELVPALVAILGEDRVRVATPDLPA